MPIPLNRTVSSKEMSDPEVQALAIMGYLAKFQKLGSRETTTSKKNERVYVRGVDLNNVHVNKAVSFPFCIPVPVDFFYCSSDYTSFRNL